MTTMDKPAQMKEADFITSLARGLQVLEAFGKNATRHSIASAALATQLDRATVRRCLLTLTQLGYVDYDGKFFSLTHRILRLGTSYLVALPLAHLVQPMLDSLSQRVGQSTSVSILDGEDIVFIARAVQRRVMAVALMPGSRLPAYCTSMGRVLLAAQADEEVRHILRDHPLAPMSPKTVTDPDEILQRIERARERGYATNDQEIELGFRSISVPLVNARGQTVAALNIEVAATQPDVSALVDLYIEPLKTLQAELSHILP
jgi:IclR family pca regulon transcriptional regulator